MSKFIIEQANHCLGAFYRVLNNDMIVKQSESKKDCLEWIKCKVIKKDKIELSKVTVNAFGKLGMNATVVMLDSEDYYTNKHDAELIIYLDNEANYEGDVIYKLYTIAEGFKAELWDVWNKDASPLFPKVINGEKELRNVIKVISKDIV